MPRPPSSGQYVTEPHNMATANSTLHAFIGGRQKSWMTDSTLAQSSPRPPPPARRQPVDSPQPPTASVHPPRQVRRPSQQLSPAIPPNLLPSPAPSDEPSPSLSNPTDSPALRSRLLTQTQQTSCTNALTAHQPISPGSHEKIVVAACPLPTAEAHSSAAMQAVADQRLPNAQASQAMAPPRLPEASRAGQASTVASVSQPVDLRGGAHPGPGPGSTEGPAPKRRRFDAISILLDLPRTMTQLVQFIDQRLEDLGGHSTADDIERPRLQLLKDACLKNDLFYLHFHSLYCTWSVDPETLPAMPGFDMKAVYQGFGMLESVLKKNELLAPHSLVWCARFPDPAFNTSRPRAVAMVARFLTSLAQNWVALDQNIPARQYPYLVDELLITLHCCSVVMQNILFTACRRRLGLSDEHLLGTRAQEIFDDDLRRHLDPKGQLQPPSLPDNMIERWNQNRIILYRKLFEKQQELIRQSRQIQQSQQQRSYAQNSPSNTPNHIASQVIQANNTHYAVNQAAVTAASRPRSSFDANSPVTRPSDPALSWPQQTSGSHSVAGMPTTPHAPLPPQTSGHPSQTAPSTFASQGSAAMPNSPNGAATQVTAGQQLQSQLFSGPQQYHAGLTSREQAIQLMQQRQQQQSHPQQHLQQRLQQYILQQQQQQQYMFQGYMQPQWSQALHQSFVPYAYVPQIYSPGQSPTFVAPSSSQAGGHQPGYQAQPTRGVMAQQQWNQQAVPMGANNANRGASHTTLLFPPREQVIDRSQYPHSHQEKKSLLMALHQVHARSPERTLRFGDADERFYQSVQSFAVAPFRLAYLNELDITISPEQHSQLCRTKKLPDLDGNPVTTTVHEYNHGSLRLRARCCRLLSEKASAESEWVTKESMWPEHIYIRFNDESLTIRRSTHNGKDLPVELTDYVLPGVNKLEVATSSEGPTSADKRGNLFYMAIEVVGTASHSDIVKSVQSSNRIDREVTLAKIRSRIDCVPDEDGIAIIDRTGDTTQELSIDLTDPFSAKIFDVPARGVSCTHMECFDLETWLATRPTKQLIKCGHKENCTCPQRTEPSEPDKWKCPICFGDARPGSLCVDTFLEDVREKLQSENKLDTKSILVAADGTWRPVVEPAGDDEDSDVDGPASRETCFTLRDGPSKASSIERAPVEIIELD